MESLASAWSSFVVSVADRPFVLFGLLPYLASLASNALVSVVYEILDRFSPATFYKRFKITYGAGKREGERAL